MATDPIAATETILPWRGIHHIALATPDLDATRHFYGRVLGMQISDIFPSREGRGRHCLVFLKEGDPDTWGIHFFERMPSAATLLARSAEGDGPIEGPLLHIAFRLPDDASARALRERLHDHHVAITEIPELGSFIFWDNNSLMLEVTWPNA